MIELIKAKISDVNLILDIQKECFSEFLEKYHDNEINPCNESLDSLRNYIKNENFAIYIIKYNNINAGIIKVKQIDKNTCKLHDFGVIPKFRDRHIGTNVFLELRNLYSFANKWTLSTILQEKRNTHFYEKLGFIKTTNRKPTIINEYMTIIGYELDLLIP